MIYYDKFIAQKMKFSINASVAFTEEIHNEKYMCD